MFHFAVSKLSFFSFPFVSVFLKLELIFQTTLSSFANLSITAQGMIIFAAMVMQKWGVTYIATGGMIASTQQMKSL